MKERVKRVRNLADYGYPSTDIAALSEKALEITRRLTELYGELPFSYKDPMSMLVEILLSHRTYDAQTDAAYENLLKRFGSWEAVRDAPTAEVQETIANVNFPEVKAPRLQTIMRQITEERGNLDLNFLRTLPLEDAAAWLNRFEGVGPKTTACAIVLH
jgi:endonuclease III